MDIVTTPYASFGSVYGPAGGNGATPATRAQQPAAPRQILGLEIPVLIALAVVTWWVMQNFEE